MRLPHLLALPFLLASGSVMATPVINEIMFHPAPDFPEPLNQEWIELFNPDPAPVDLSGWKLSSAIDFIFPGGTSIPANGYLVVAADTAAFHTKYPSVVNYVGPWIGTLSNNGAKITLSDALSVEMDKVSYADSGDWAVRVREATYSGWAWQMLANGGGRSLELRHAAVDNNIGENWGDSTTVNGTPGAVNSLAVANIAPMIKKVKHSPAVPKSTDIVTISCDLVDESPPASLTATLFWRDATSASPGAFQSAAMTGDGTGSFYTNLAARADKAIIEFYVQASDGTLTRTWPAPTSEGQNANCQYQVDNEVVNATDSYYRLVMTAAENAAFNSLASSNPNSNRQFNQTFVATRGTETTIRYRSSMRIRGNSSRSYQFKPMRITFPGDDTWEGIVDFNLNPKATFLQYTAMRMFQAAGIRAEDSIPVELRRNGTESSTSSGSTPDYGKWVRIEEMNRDMISHHWPEANTGNLYKKVDGGGAQDFYWRSGQPAPSSPDSLLDGWSKQNNTSSNDWSDLRSFMQVWQAAASPHFPGSSATDVAGSNGSRISGIGNWNSTAFTTADISSLSTVSDFDQWARWFAVMTIIQDLETKISNGVDDDYASYFIPIAGAPPQLQLIPNDQDTIFGLGDDQQAFNYTGLYDMSEGGQSGFTFRTLLPLFGTTGTAGNAAFRAKYFTAIRQLYGSVFNADTTGNPNPPFYQFLDNHLGGWVPAATITAMKNFATSRQTYLLGLIGSPAITPTAPTSTATVTSVPGTLMISEVLANNFSAVNVGGLFPDIVELRNTGAVAIDLEGRSFTDNVTQPLKFIFPSGTTISAGGYLVLYADGGTGTNHLPFAINNNGETLALYDTPANGGVLIDSVTFGVQPRDFSIGRTGAALDTWALGTPTPDAPNNTVASFANPSVLRINEWLGNPNHLVTGDFVELYNPAATPVALGGMIVTDDPINYPLRQAFPPLSFMAATSFLRLDAKGSSATPGNGTELPFSIATSAGWIALLGQNGATVDSVDVVSQPPGVSTGRTPDGGATFTRFAQPGGIPTPGQPNTAPTAATLALLDGLRISEIHYNPIGGNNFEFIELRNIGAGTLDLTGVRFTQGITFTFPATTLPSGGFVVLVKDLASFQQRYGTNKPVGGVYTGSLDNNGETLTLTLPNPLDVNILSFAYNNTWYPSTDGGGYSLELLDSYATLPHEFDQKEKWGASGVVDGTPGSNGPPNITSALTASGILGDAFTYQITAANGPTGFSASGLPTGLSVNTSNGLISGAPGAYGVFPVTIGATNSGGSSTAPLVLTIASSGPLDHFVWSAISTSQSAGVSFPVQAVAKDAQNRTVLGYNGTPALRASFGSGTTSTLVITEVFDQDPDQFEIQNVSGQTINTTGWFALINNAGSGTNNVNTLYATPAAMMTQPALPASFAPGQLLHVTDDATAPQTFWDNIPWSHVNKRRGWVMLVNNTGVIVDFVIWGYPASGAANNDVASLNVTVGGFTLNPVAQGAWTGAGVTQVNTPAGIGMQRTGTADNNTSNDWSWFASSISPPAQNTGLTVPFTGGATPLTLTPTSATCSNGVFIGFATITETATGASIKIDDAAGHSSSSNTFNLTTAPPDTDGDGMTDAWESANGLNPAVNDAALDQDGDGQSNLAEFRAGTDPRDPNSVLRLATATAIPGGTVTLTWPAVPGKVYRVVSSTTLAGWVPVEGTTRIATGTTESAVFTDPTAGGQRSFFRVELLTGN